MGARNKQSSGLRARTAARTEEQGRRAVRSHPRVLAIRLALPAPPTAPREAPPPRHSKMPPRRATPGKPRAITGLELDHPGPAWLVGASRRGTPAKLRARADDDDELPKPKSAKKAKSPAKSPARAVTPKSPAVAAGKRIAKASPAKSPAKSPKAASPARGKSPAKSPAAKSAAKPAKAAAAKSPTSATKRLPKPVPESTAQTARRQLAEASLGDYWTTSGSRRKSNGGSKVETAVRSASPAPARAGDVPLGYEEDEPVSSVGGGWLVNKVLLSCIICTLASAIEQGYRAGAVGARPLTVFAMWGVVSGLVSSLWAKVLGWATESLQVGLRRTVITVLVDQLVMGARAAVPGGRDRTAQHARAPCCCATGACCSPQAFALCRQSRIADLRLARLPFPPFPPRAPRFALRRGCCRKNK